MRRVLLSLAIWLFAALAGNTTLAHGSVTAEDDLCLIRIGFYSAHFKIYQPLTSRYSEFCEDLPAGGETIFVMEYLHQVLGEVPVEFRIVRNITGLGRFTRLEDLVTITDLDAVTVFHQLPVMEKDVYTVRFDFEEEGDYLGIVTARHPQTEDLYMAVFPFRVGRPDWGAVPLVLLLAALAQLVYWFANGKLHAWYRKYFRALPALLVLLWPFAETRAGESVVSDNGVFHAEFASEVQPLPLNSIHDWVIHLMDGSGHPLSGADVQVSGGMPAHNHGLATAPQVNAGDGEGVYRIEGLRFHMPGEWFLLLDISHQGRSDKIRIPFSL